MLTQRDARLENRLEVCLADCEGLSLIRSSCDLIEVAPDQGELSYSALQRSQFALRHGRKMPQVSSHKNGDVGC